MPSLSFSALFADRVERGEKLHSIRGRRKRPEQWLPGKTLHMFTAMRTKHCRRLGRGVITSVHDIEIFDARVLIDNINVDSPTELSAFARADGFLTWNEFVTFFREIYGLPWSGSLIKWRLDNPRITNAQEGNSTMSKAKLIDAVDALQDEGLNKKTVEALVVHVGTAIANTLQSDGEVTIPGVGKLKLQERAARTGRNPKTGEALKIAAKTTVKFSAAKALTDAIN